MAYFPFTQDLSFFFFLIRGVQFECLERNTAFVSGFEGRSPFSVFLTAFTFSSGFHPLTIPGTSSGGWSLFLPFYPITFVTRSFGFFCEFSFCFTSIFELAIDSVS
ncbi:unnamed protein product [Hymenolepis diminuta]|uniref:Uncharacterized protein n=1 Tax=Hymenolepis diminuta TaxID=6216 RepID=A0A564YYM4_HYMDI|nr:unnamed protein product [Hymenolepis diminuta]